MAYFMISVDDPQTNKEFAESLDSDFPLLSNPTKEVAEAYGVVTAERAFPFRWTSMMLHPSKPSRMTPSWPGCNEAPRLRRPQYPGRWI